MQVQAGTRLEAAQGYVVWRGNSPEDGAPLVCVATGFLRPSDNPKTGPMVQVYVIREDVNPAEAVKTGQSSSVCNSCPLQPALVKAAKEAAKRAGMPAPELPVCYVTSHYGPRSVWEAWKAGSYPAVTVRQFKRLFRGRKVRLGSYGNFSNVALGIVRAIAKASAGWTLYEHNWRLERVQPMRALAMASVSTLAEKAEAKALGWRTFRVTRDANDVQADEVRCPASDEAGKKTTCERCRLCCGTERQAKSVVIMDHGPTSDIVKQKRRDARVALQTV